MLQAADVQNLTTIEKATTLAKPLKTLGANTVIVQTEHLSRGNNPTPKHSKLPSNIWNYLRHKCESLAAGKFLDFEM